MPELHFTANLLAQGGGSILTQMMPLILMFAVLYFIVLRPMSKQEKERRKRVESLKKGDQVVIGGGILGRVSNADDDKVAVVEIADRVKIRVLKKDIVDTQESALKAEQGPGAKDDKKAEKKTDKPEKGEKKDEQASKGA